MQPVNTHSTVRVTVLTLFSPRQLKFKVTIYGCLVQWSFIAVPIAPSTYPDLYRASNLLVSSHGGVICIRDQSLAQTSTQPTSSDLSTALSTYISNRYFIWSFGQYLLRIYSVLGNVQNAGNLGVNERIQCRDWQAFCEKNVFIFVGTHSLHYKNSALSPL